MLERSWSVQSEIKSVRLKWQEPQADLSWAYMKQMRERNKTKKIYDVNPYVEVYQFRDNLYGLYTYNLDGLSDPWMYLIVGPQKALLIDTAFGLGDTKGLVDEISGGKPLIVANTHCGPDHAYGNCRFEKVYCHKYDVPRLKKQNAHMWDYLFDEEGNNKWVAFDRKDLPAYKEYEIVECEDGHIFELGEGYNIELFWMGAHTPGSSGFLDRQNRIFFPGDNLVSMRTSLGGVEKSLNTDPYGEFATVKVLKERLQILLDKYFDEFDYVFPQHLIVNVEKGVLQYELLALEEIVANPENYDAVSFTESPHTGELVESKLKYIQGFGPIGYRI